jgi:hypothetical protein
LSPQFSSNTHQGCEIWDVTVGQTADLDGKQSPASILWLAH